MANSIIELIEKNPIWSFSCEVILESGELMELSLSCTIQAEIVDDQLVLLVTLLDTNFPGDVGVFENVVKKEFWDKFRAIPLVVFFHPNQGFS